MCLGMKSNNHHGVKMKTNSIPLSAIWPKSPGRVYSPWSDNPKDGQPERRVTDACDKEDEAESPHGTEAPLRGGQESASAETFHGGGRRRSSGATRSPRGADRAHRRRRGRSHSGSPSHDQELATSPAASCTAGFLNAKRKTLPPFGRDPALSEINIGGGENQKLSPTAERVAPRTHHIIV